MRTYTIYKLDTEDNRTEAVGRAILPEDKTSRGFAVAFSSWVTRNRRHDESNVGYEAVALDAKTGLERGCSEPGKRACVENIRSSM